jgi:hypothetical protein
MIDAPTKLVIVNLDIDYLPGGQFLEDKSI